MSINPTNARANFVLTILIFFTIKNLSEEIFQGEMIVRTQRFCISVSDVQGSPTSLD